MVFIEYKLKKNDWNVSKTAEEIDIQRSHLYNKIDKFELKRSWLTPTLLSYPNIDSE